MKRILLKDQFWLRSRLHNIVEGLVPGFDRSKHPLVWVESMESLNFILSDHNRWLMKLIAEASPSTYVELLDDSGMAPEDLWKTLQVLVNFRLLDIKTKDHVLVMTPASGPLEILVD